jgi:flagella basal body P-ring formation protein FlgA
MVPGDAFLSEQELPNKRLRKYLSPNEIITTHAMEAIPEMTRGKQITVRVVGNGVCIQADAETLEEGYFGKKIKVKLIGNGKIITASVVGHETADVMLVSRW